MINDQGDISQTTDEDGFYWVTRLGWEDDSPQVALRWKGRWAFPGDENIDDKVSAIHGNRLEEPNAR